MKLIEALAKVNALKQSAVTVGDAAACWRVAPAHAAKILARLSAAGHLVRLKRGLWAFPDRVEPFALPEYLTAPDPAYVSLHSALYHHGWITQIPSVIYAVTLGRARRFETPAGVVSLHHLDPGFFFGYDVVGRAGFKVATPEKALLDVFYLACGRSEGLQALPELELPEGLKLATLQAMARRIPSPSRRRRVLARLERLRATASG